VLTDKGHGGADHPIGIERLRHMPDDVAQERARRRAVPNRIAVGFALSRRCARPIVRHSSIDSNADVARFSRALRRAQYFVCGDRVIDRDAGDLRRGMHARVGASGSVQRIVDADDRIDFLFEDLLDADRVRLPLPPGVVGAVVRRS
jgi:hypothetical protein